MKKIVIAFFMLFVSLQSISVEAQTTSKTESKYLEKPYNSQDNAQAKIDALIKQAKKN